MNPLESQMRRSQLSRLTEAARSCSGNGRTWPMSEKAELFINLGTSVSERELESQDDIATKCGRLPRTNGPWTPKCSPNR